jgi:hypothetical protein
VLHRVKEERNIIHTLKKEKANWIGHILLWKCLQGKAIEGKGEVKGRRGRRRKQLPDNHKETRRCWKFKA